MSQSFHSEAKFFVRRIIRIRKTLIREGFSRLPDAQRIILHLEEPLNFWPYNSNSKMAAFIHNHRAEIMYLMPGEKSKSHKSLMESFKVIVNRSEQILNLKYETVC